MPAGKTITIKEGCVFLFKNYTGLKVDGALIVGGTPEQPVLFTSQNESYYNPNIRIVNGRFSQNGQYNLTVNDMDTRVQDRITANGSLQKEYRDNPTAANLKTSSSQYSQNYHDAARYATFRNVGYALAAVAAAGFVLTFVF